MCHSGFASWLLNCLVKGLHGLMSDFRKVPSLTSDWVIGWNLRCYVIRKTERDSSMQNESIIENEPEKAPETEKGSQLNVRKDTAQNLLENTELRADSLRQIIDGGLLGVCLTFLLVLLSVQQKTIDVNLIRALYTFVIAIPLLICGFCFASFKISNFVRSSEMLTLIFTMQAARFIEVFGWLAVAVGVFFVILHLSVFAAILFLLSIPACLILLALLSIIVAITHRAEWIEYNEQKEQKKTSSKASDA